MDPANKMAYSWCACKYSVTSRFLTKVSSCTIHKQAWKSQKNNRCKDRFYFNVTKEEFIQVIEPIKFIKIN